MRIILEKKDVLVLLGSALGYELREEEVKIQADPFEVHLNDARINEIGRTAKAGTVEVQAKTPTVHSPKPENVDLTEELIRSANIAAQLPSAVIDPDTRGLNDFSRPLFANESEDPPGEDYKGELPQ